MKIIGAVRGVAIAGLWLAICSGCAAPPVAERTRLASTIAAEGAMAERRFRAGRFELLGYWRPAARPGAGLRVYLEGDGLAWRSRHAVSPDPTPVDPVALRLAAADPSPAAILYLARPCQYVGVGEPQCDPIEWTDRRYAQEITEAIDGAIDLALESRAAGVGLRSIGRSPEAGIELVGYSGGGVLAANVAAGREDVSLLVTIAAPLDLAAWVELHGVSPLAGSVDPATLGAALAATRQLHFVGADDENVPISLARSYLAALGDAADARLIEVPGFGHRCCWARDWPQLATELSAGMAPR
jgi:hypothetical protein